VSGELYEDWKFKIQLMASKGYIFCDFDKNSLGWTDLEKVMNSWNDYEKRHMGYRYQILDFIGVSEDKTIIYRRVIILAFLH